MKIVIVIGLMMVAGLMMLSIYDTPFSKPVIKPSDSVATIGPRVQKPIVSKDPNPFINPFLKEVDGFIKSALANRQAPGAALAVLRDTSIIFLKGYGLREIG